MNPILAFLKTTRPINLLIIAVTMYFMRWFVVGGYLEHLSRHSAFPGFSLQIETVSDLHFFLLTLIMVLLAASGNLINDYFDVKVDRINKPDRITIDRGLKRRVAIVAHHSMNILAVTLGIYLGWAEKIWFYAFTPVLIASLLWIYSYHLKKTFLLGNIIVSLLVSIVPIWATYDILNTPYLISDSAELNSFPVSDFFILIAIIVLCYTIQAYVISLFREIAKDAEDVQGDKEFGYRTMPIVWGWDKTRSIVFFSMIVWWCALAVFTYYLIVSFIPIWGFLFGILVLIPFGIAAASIRFKNIKKAHFTRASFWLKVTLGAGLLYALVIPHQMGYFLYHYFH